MDDDERPSSFADAKAEQDDFEQHLRENDDYEDAVEAEVQGERPEDRGTATSMP
jgi:hypothetical protein